MKLITRSLPTFILVARNKPFLSVKIGDYHAIKANDKIYQIAYSNVGLVNEENLFEKT